MAVVGICGLIGNGKGTVGDILVKERGFQKLSFADKLKDAVAVMFDWDREMLEGITDESRAWREQPDEFWTAETGEQVTPDLFFNCLELIVCATAFMMASGLVW